MNHRDSKGRGIERSLLLGSLVKIVSFFRQIIDCFGIGWKTTAQLGQDSNRDFLSCTRALKPLSYEATPRTACNFSPFTKLWHLLFHYEDAGLLDITSAQRPTELAGFRSCCQFYYSCWRKEKEFGKEGIECRSWRPTLVPAQTFHVWLEFGSKSHSPSSFKLLPFPVRRRKKQVIFAANKQSKRFKVFSWRFTAYHHRLNHFVNNTMGDTKVVTCISIGDSKYFNANAFFNRIEWSELTSAYKGPIARQMQRPDQITVQTSFAWFGVASQRHLVSNHCQG